MIIVTPRLGEVQKIGGRVGIMKQGRFREVHPQDGENFQAKKGEGIGDSSLKKETGVSDPGHQPAETPGPFFKMNFSMLFG
jgi:hypothetical protein